MIILIYIILINIIYIYIDMLTKGSSVRSPGALSTNLTENYDLRDMARHPTPEQCSKAFW